MYDISTGERLSGGLGNDEKIIRKWFDKTFIKEELNTAWKSSQKFQPVTMNNNENL